ncbi:MAG: zinc ribbon domain-containing protein [Candidatus Krumholzibacteriota bacterium]|nr:zinc ribbon domain-containing protein [Candidatus Krumholzibacteriota bacterium]
MSTLKPGPKDSESFNPWHEELLDSKKPETYAVILEGLKNNIETNEAFTIKFSLLIREPVNKIRHMTRNIPATIWKGKRRKKALAILALVEEAGGKARIEISRREEEKSAVKKPDLGTAVQAVCVKCGFPIKEDDLFCKFCLTPLKEKAKNDVKINITKIAPAIPPQRLIIYVLIILGAFIFALISK